MLPFLRVIRDKRGYETTYLMHSYREGSRQRSRILYVFRTPGGVRVGRESLEPDTQRQIESYHPGIAFDWKAVFANRQVIDPAPEPRRPRRQRQPEEESAAAPSAPAAPEPPEARPAIPSALQGATPDEQMAFLTHWYPVVRDRIPVRMADPARREALGALAERLNPAAWTDANEIAEGLVRAAEALDRLSRVLSRRRRRRRPSPPPAGPPPDGPPPTET
ncbi:MAG: hypothetical protein HY824_14095 [Acidobacteria bacterium]|nr:hypothetical protein [Acidobacteriota bacterium]